MIYHLCLIRHGEYNGNWDHWVERLDELVKVKEVCPILEHNTNKTNNIEQLATHNHNKQTARHPDPDYSAVKFVMS